MKRACFLICLASGLTIMTNAQGAGPIGWWPLDGSTDDMSGNGHHLQMSGDAQYVEGLYDQAVAFDGQNDSQGSIHADDDMDLFDPGWGGLTATVWVKAGDGSSSDAYEFVVSKGNRTSGNVGWSIWTENQSLLVRCNASNTSEQRASQHTTEWPLEEWMHVALVIDREADQIRGYLNGSNEGWIAGGGGPSSDSLSAWGGIDNTVPLALGHRDDGRGTLLGTVDDLRIYTGALSEAEIQAAMKKMGKEQAFDPMPNDETSDVPLDTHLSWTPGEFAVAHDVYLGTVFDDVNEASRTAPRDVLVSDTQDVNTFDPGRLEFGQTYFWRVDEVNGAPDYIVFPGAVWRFTVELFSYPITSVTAAASSSQNSDMGAEKTVDGSGLNPLNQHSTDGTDMWLSGMGDTAPWIEYAFDRVYRLHEMWVWNSNQLIEAFVGLGAKDVTITYSVDGIEWTPLAGAVLFNQGTGQANYAHNTVIDFGGAMARYVHIDINAGWGPISQYGLSEVRFFYIPMAARAPEPADAQTVDDVDVLLRWRAGREAHAHQVYLGTDAENLDWVETTSESHFTVDNRNYATTYYWSVTEVNEAEAVPAYSGDVWNFRTPDYFTVDDFEQYNDNCKRIFFAWEDGLGHNGAEGIEGCEVPPYEGNGGGSIVGNNQTPFAERTIVNAGGSTQSLPFSYDNAIGPSEATLEIDEQDWTAGGIKTLSLFFYGQPGNTGQLYVKINNTKIVYDGDAGDIMAAQWQVWNIDLTTLNGLQNVTSLTIGMDGANALGLLYIDDIRLYP